MRIDKKKVGERIYEIRKQNGYSMEQFGKLIGGAPRGSVNSWEKGVNLPNKERLEMIAVMGNMSVDELLYGTFEDYVADLICNNLGIKIPYRLIRRLASELMQDGWSYGDEVAILQIVKDFLDTNWGTALRPVLFYESISDEDALFIGYLKTDEKLCLLEYADASHHRQRIFRSFTCTHDPCNCKDKKGQRKHAAHKRKSP